MTAILAVRLGELGHHARGRNLGVSFGAEAAETPPASGTAFVFAKELQRDPVRGTEWLTWAEAPGRLLVAVPPFAVGPSQAPAPWEARPVAPLAGGASAVAQLVAAERRHELVGGWMPLERIGAEVATIGWRRHPAGGLVVVTALPLWSLTLLDHRDACRAWLADLLAQAGTAGDEAAAASGPPAGEPSNAEWAILLHWETGPFESVEHGLAALAASELFRVEPGAAREALAALVEKGLIKGGELTAAGQERLSSGRFADYADELRRMHHV